MRWGSEIFVNDTNINPLIKLENNRNDNSMIIVGVQSWSRYKISLPLIPLRLKIPLRDGTSSLSTLFAEKPFKPSGSRREFPVWLVIRYPSEKSMRKERCYPISDNHSQSGTLRNFQCQFWYSSSVALRNLSYQFWAPLDCRGQNHIVISPNGLCSNLLNPLDRIEFSILIK